MTLIEGIGPKIASLLEAAGITNFDHLANAEVEELEKILAATELRLAKPGSWPKQARLAVLDDWEQLHELQNKLKGGQQE